MPRISIAEMGCLLQRQPRLDEAAVAYPRGSEGRNLGVKPPGLVYMHNVCDVCDGQNLTVGMTSVNDEY